LGPYNQRILKLNHPPNTMTRLTTASATAFFAIPVFFSSCATILNSPVQNIHIATTEKIRHVSIDNCISADSSQMGAEAPKTYLVPRSTKNLVVHLQLDSGNKTILFRPRNSLAYWANLYFNYGIGMLVDRDNLKRYCYPSRTWLTMKDTVVYRRRFAPLPKGTLRLSVGLPLINTFRLQSQTGASTSTGLFGLEAGLDYFYKTDQYISLSVGAATDRGPEERFGKGFFEYQSSVYASIKNNYVIGSFDLGYGISLSGLEWNRSAVGDTIPLHQSVKSTGLGLSLQAQYRFGNYFRMGVLYQPNIFSTNLTPAFNYQHYIAVGFTWKLPLNRVRGR